MIRRLPSYRTYGVRTLSKRFDVFLHEVNNAGIRNDVDAIHDLRVASRRFHAAAVLFKECVTPTVLSKCERRVKQIRKSAGAVRDGDVQILFVDSLIKKKSAQQYRSGLERLLLRLSQRRKKGMNATLSALDAFQKGSIVASMKRAIISGSSRRSAFRILPLRRRAALEIASHVTQLLRYEEFVKQSTAITELHEMRIAAKRLRYVMEIFNPIYGGRLNPFIRIVRSIQDTLGETHDCDVWLNTIPGFIEKERARTTKFFGRTTSFPQIEKGILFFFDYVQRRRMKQYRTFLRTWKSAEQQQTWKKVMALTCAA